MPNGDEEKMESEATESGDTAEAYGARDEVAKQPGPIKTRGEIKFVRIGCSRLLAEPDEDGKHQRLSFIGDNWGTRKIDNEYLGKRELTDLIEFLYKIKGDLK